MPDVFASPISTLLTCLIPLIAGIVGWITNVVAIKLTFWPLEFIGIWKPYIGWQGIVPMQARKMTELACDLITTRLLTPREIFGRLDADAYAHHLRPHLAMVLEDVLQDVVRRRAPALWDMASRRAKAEVIEAGVDHSTQYVAAMYRDMQEHVDEVFDLKQMAIDVLMQDVSLLNHIFQEVGHKEFAFIIRSGFWFGGLFGLLQMCVWIVYPQVWVLPVAGFLVGWATNFLALKMIFEPAEPRNVCGLRIQGLFLRRQPEVAEAYGQIVSERLVTAGNIVDSLFAGPTVPRMFELVDKHTRAAIDDYAGSGRLAIMFTMGPKAWNEFQHEISCRMMDALPVLMHRTEQYVHDALGVEEVLVERMCQLTPTEFVGLLRPVFEADEWKLILLGGVLGALVGGLQVWASLATADL